MDKLIKEFTITQWNTLAQTLCTQDSFPKASSKSIDWESRQNLFKNILPKSHIVCFEEVDHPEFFKSFYQNYEFFYQSKPHSQDGTLIGFDISQFSLVAQQFYPYFEENQEKANQFFAFLHLQHNASKTDLVIVGTHLKAKMVNDMIRKHQVQQLCDFIKQKPLPIIVLGDFNAEPSYDSIKQFQSNTQFKNSNPENHFTTFKQRSHKELRTIDYIWYNQLKFVSMDQLLSEEEIGENGLPNESFPSDHLFLTSSFEFL